MTKEYAIIDSYYEDGRKLLTTKQFVDRVNDWIAMGWEPLGSPLGQEFRLMQAMVREIK